MNFQYGVKLPKIKPTHYNIKLFGYKPGLFQLYDHHNISSFNKMQHFPDLR